jgi:hypothetical protein
MQQRHMVLLLGLVLLGQDLQRQEGLGLGVSRRALSGV